MCRQFVCDAATNTRYVGSGTDGGHPGGDCEPAVNLDGTYNFGFLMTGLRVGLKQEILFSKSLANAYYGMAPVYNYWNGCSTGGRQGYLLAQELGNELTASSRMRRQSTGRDFQTAQMWGQIVMKDLVGGPISAAKLNQTSASAVAACDAADGVTTASLMIRVPAPSALRPISAARPRRRQQIA